MSAALEPEVGAATAEEPATGSRAWRFVRRNPTIVVGGLILALVLGAALAAPLLAPIDPLEINVLVRLQGPSAEHPFGTPTFTGRSWPLADVRLLAPILAS